MISKEIIVCGLKSLETTFNGTYTAGMAETIISICSKWRESTFKSVVEYLKQEFKKSYGVELPYPKDFKDAIHHIHREEEKAWKKEVEPESPIDAEGYLIYKKTISELLKKLGGSDRFRLRSSHIDGVFACEVCFRTGCNGGTQISMRNGCAGFISEEKEKELKLIREEREKDLALNRTIKDDDSIKLQTIKKQSECEVF
jgi:hypothetical protein